MATGTTKQTEAVLAHHMEAIVAKDADGILEISPRIQCCSLPTER